MRVHSNQCAVNGLAAVMPGNVGVYEFYLVHWRDTCIVKCTDGHHYKTDRLVIHAGRID